MKGKEDLEEGNSLEREHGSAQSRKAIFLAAYEEWGTVKKGCEAAGVTRHAYGRWTQRDPDFMRSVDLMKQSFAESLEAIALDRVKNPDKNRGSDVLLLGLLNANKPAKFRPSVAMDQDSAKELITEWRKASQAVLKNTPVVEGSPDADLPVSVEKTLAEILEKRGNAPKEKDEADEAH